MDTGTDTYVKMYRIRPALPEELPPAPKLVKYLELGKNLRRMTPNDYYKSHTRDVRNVNPPHLTDLHWVLMYYDTYSSNELLAFITLGFARDIGIIPVLVGRANNGIIYDLNSFVKPEILKKMEKEYSLHINSESKKYGITPKTMLKVLEHMPIYD